MHYPIHDTEDNWVNEADSSHSHETQQKEVGVTIQLEVGGFGIKDGAHQLAFGCAETCKKNNIFVIILNIFFYQIESTFA